MTDHTDRADPNGSADPVNVNQVDAKMAAKRRRIMTAIAVAITIWTVLVLLFVDRFDVLVSDDPFDAGANLAQQYGALGVFVIWLLVTLLLLGMLAVVWRQRRRA